MDYITIIFSSTFFFLLTFTLLERSSDWQTPRWGHAGRAMFLITMPMAFAMLFHITMTVVLAIDYKLDQEIGVIWGGIGIVLGFIGFFAKQKYMKKNIPTSSKKDKKK